LELPEDKANEVAAAAAKNDGLIYHLWQKGKEFSRWNGDLPTIPRPFFQSTKVGVVWLKGYKKVPFSGLMTPHDNSLPGRE